MINGGINRGRKVDNKKREDTIKKNKQNKETDSNYNAIFSVLTMKNSFPILCFNPSLFSLKVCLVLLWFVKGANHFALKR